MHAVLFHVGSDRYALEARCVAEIVPSIPLRRIPGAPRHVKGVLDYRGGVVPVVDLCRLLADFDCPPRFGSRILVCESQGLVTGAHGTHRAESLVGVLAEHVLRVGEVDLSLERSHPGPETEHGDALGRIVSDSDGLLQFVEVGDLLPPDLLRELVRAAPGTTEGA